MRVERKQRQGGARLAGARRWTAALLLTTLPAGTFAQVATPSAADVSPKSSQPVASTAAPAVKVEAHDRAKADRLYLHGARLLEQAKFPEAEAAFGRAVALDPTRQEFVQGLVLAQEHRITALLQASAQARSTNPAAADRFLAQARGLDPQNPRVTQHDAPQPRTIAQLHLPATPPQGVALLGTVVLLPNAERHSFHQRGDRRDLVKQIAQAYGLTAAIDPDMTAKDVRIDLDEVDYATALRVFDLAADAFTTPLDPHMLLVAEDNSPNRARLERMVQEVVPLPGYSIEQITDAANMVRSVFDLKQVSFEAQLGSMVVRAPADTLDVVNATLADLLNTGSEVVVDVKLYNVSSEHARNQGVTLPSSLGAFNVRSEAASIVSANQTLVDQLIANGIIPSGTSTTVIAAYLVFVAGVSSTSALKNTFLLLGGGLTQTGLTAGSVPVLNLALVQSDARELDDVQLRVADRTSAMVKSGTRYPIQTSLFSDIATSSTSSSSALSSLLAQYLGTSSLSSSSVVPQIQYEDLGLVLKAEPHVQRGGVIEMKLEVKLTALTGASINGLPVLASRQFSLDATMDDGETALLSSNATRSEIRAASGIPGLSELPGFQGGTDRQTDTITGNLVLLVTPHIVRRGHQLPKGPYLPLEKRPETD